ncbi:UDP-N-acetylenolpyruvoylglucosamine reductase [Frondihabitans sp. 762G35]|nr:UDP-N-acetylmuramate dehydrogenase [Frondihabitans sp. 762G35]ARC57574.1 UDP-N-acetylenolpyruvoylglucosamine reductase [Frondihabitans sp. 762G35]
MTALSDLTTMQVGGVPSRLVVATEHDELLEAAREIFFAGDDEWFVLGGGSNTVAADEGFEGTVLRVATRGVERLDAPEGRVRLRVQAGEDWDDLVRHTVDNGWAGIEALSGIPGSTGASPVQNIGAYGQEVSSSLVSVDFLDAETGEFRRIPRANLGLDYRTSVFKPTTATAGRRGVITAVEFELLDDSALGTPIAYAQLATALGVELGSRVPVADTRRRVLELRARKGMVLDPSDRDTFSSGSFFTNPIVPREALDAIPADAPRWETAPEPRDVAVPLGEQPAPPPPANDSGVKLSAAWLIEHAGLGRGFHLPGSGAALSSKHTLAITNRGGAKAEEVAQLARYVQSRVAAEFGVVLQPEPVLLGLAL